MPELLGAQGGGFASTFGGLGGGMPELLWGYAGAFVGLGGGMPELLVAHGGGVCRNFCVLKGGYA